MRVVLERGGTPLRIRENGAEVARFAYDPLGRRVEKVAGGLTNRYVYDRQDILRETRGVVVRTYTHGPGIDEPLAHEETGAVRSYHADGLGSIVKLTDANGAIAHTYQYDAWGNIETGASMNGHAFTGREWDPETGLYYYRARYYDPKQGRFISEDPGGAIDGPNLYTYVGNRPVNLVDPLGLYSFDEFLYDSAQFSAGFGDTISFGLSGYIRQQWGVDDVVDRCSGAYAAGMYTEIGVEAALTGGSFALRGAAKGITQAAARRGMSSAVARGVKGVSELHHVNPLKTGLFPTAALPAGVALHAPRQASLHPGWHSERYESGPPERSVPWLALRAGTEQPTAQRRKGCSCRGLPAQGSPATYRATTCAIDVQLGSVPPILKRERRIRAIGLATQQQGCGTVAGIYSFSLWPSIAQPTKPWSEPKGIWRPPSTLQQRLAESVTLPAVNVDANERGLLGGRACRTDVRTGMGGRPVAGGTRDCGVSSRGCETRSDLFAIPSGGGVQGTPSFVGRKTLSGLRGFEWVSP